MTIKHRIVSALLRCYPAAWRAEYGPELSDVLLSRPLRPGTVIDVVRSGIHERARSMQPATVIGLAMMLLMLAGFAQNIGGFGLEQLGLVPVLRPSLKTAPTVAVVPFASDYYVAFLAACGFWIQLRQRGKLLESGVAAMRISFIAGIPVMIAGILMMSGTLGVVVAHPGDAATTFADHGFAFTYYSAAGHLPNPLGVFLSPLFRLPEALIWGAIGGWLGRGARDHSSRLTG